MDAQATEREVCERIFNDYRLASHFQHVDLMILAYRQGAKDEASRIAALAVGTKPPKADPSVTDLMDYMMESIRDYDRLNKSAVVSNSNGYVMTGDEPRHD